MARLVAFLIFLVQLQVQAQQETYSRQFQAMGCAFEVTIVMHEDSAQSAQRHLDYAVAEINRIERLISSWDSTSQTSLINQNAGLAYMQVDPELINLIKRSNAVSSLTSGAFDISFAAMAHLWDFDPAKRNEWPDSSAVQNAQSLVNYKNVWVKDSLVLLANVGMRIGFGAIGKGYAADKVATDLRFKGIKGGLVNASGDIYAWGINEKDEPWKAAVVDPKKKRKIRFWIPITDQAIVTSGDYEKYKVKDGVRYAHIINPKTGYPAQGVISATVLAPRAELADALATAIFVLGVDEGLKLINGVNRAECIIIDSTNEIWYSKHIETLLD